MLAPARARQPRRGRSSATSSAARTSWSSTATASSIDQDGEIVARGAPVRGGAAGLRRSTRRASPRRACATRATARRSRARAARWRRPPARDGCRPRRWATRASAGRSPSPLDRTRRSTRALVHSECATTSTRTASSASCSALSGGIDSALVALIAVDALGAGARRRCVGHALALLLATSTQADARAIAREPRHRAARARRSTGAMDAYTSCCAEPFDGTRARTSTEENLQARIRGNLLMALSNKFGWLVLTTGNKSEMSVGYATLYGDMAGGFAVLKDVFKTLGLPARALAQRAGAGASWCRRRCSSAPPSAELRPDQRDEDSLPPYDVLDAILAGYVEEDLDAEELVRRGLPARGRRARDRARGPRRVQAPPGAAGRPHDPRKAFGRDRRAADHEPLPRSLGAAARRRRTATVTRDSAHSRPWSSVMSTSQTQLVRPRWQRAALACTVPSRDRPQEARVVLLAHRRACRRPARRRRCRARPSASAIAA